MRGAWRGPQHPALPTARPRLVPPGAMPDPRTDPRPTPLPPTATPTPMTGSVPVVARPADGAAVPATEGVGRPVADAPVGGSKRLGLSLTQIAGGALAAVTAAVAASYLGVAGTLIGAGLGSVVSSVAAPLYSTSLSRAARASKVLVVRPAGSGTGPLEASAAGPRGGPPRAPARAAPGPRRQAVVEEPALG